MTRRLFAFTIVLAALSACSSSDSESSPVSTNRPAATTTVAPTSPTTASTTAAPAPVASSTVTPTSIATTAPPTTVPVETQLKSLLERYDAAATDILLDPRVASDPSSPKVTAFLALFPKGSAFAADTVTLWAGEGEKGRFYKPGPKGFILKSTFQKVTAQTATEVTFSVCAQRSASIVDANGNPIEGVGGISDGSVVAVLVDGAWLLRDLTVVATAECAKAITG